MPKIRSSDITDRKVYLNRRAFMQSMMAAGGASLVADTVFAQQPAIQLRDGSNNPVPQSGIPVTAVIATGGGTLLGTVTVNSNASGVATFTNLAIAGTIGARTIQFTSPGLTPVTSGTITITAGAASRLVLTTQPSAGASSGSNEVAWISGWAAASS